MNAFASGLALSILTAGLAAQQPQPAPVVEPRPVPAPAEPASKTKDEVIAEKIARMRKMLREGKLVRSHVRVTVRLTNGNKLKGVVKDGKLIERVDGLRFVTAEAGAEGAGIRVWYYDDTSSYIFLPYDRIQRYWVGERLTDDQVKTIEAELVAREEVAAKRYAELAAERARERRAEAERKAREAEKPAPAQPAANPLDALDDAESKRLMAIFTEFPPSEGWGPEKKREIEVRRITVGAFPDERSRRFLSVFDDWMKAKALADKVGAGEGGGDPAEPQPAQPQPAEPDPKSGGTTPEPAPSGGKASS